MKGNNIKKAIETVQRIDQRHPGFIANLIKCINNTCIFCKESDCGYTIDKEPVCLECYRLYTVAGQKLTWD